MSIASAVGEHDGSLVGGLPHHAPLAIMHPAVTVHRPSGCSRNVAELVARFAPAFVKTLGERRVELEEPLEPLDDRHGDHEADTQEHEDQGFERRHRARLPRCPPRRRAGWVGGTP